MRADIRRLESAVVRLHAQQKSEETTVTAVDFPSFSDYLRLQSSEASDTISTTISDGVVFELKGLQQKPALNGQRIVLEEWSAIKCRWQVSLADEEPFRVRSENIRIAEPDFPSHEVDPRHASMEIRSHPTLPGHTGAFASRDITAGSLFFMETPFLRVPSQSFATLAREYFKLSSDDRTTVIELYANSSITLQESYRFSPQVTSARLSDAELQVFLKKEGVQIPIGKENELCKFIRAFDTNACDISSHQGGAGFALYIIICKANHSCIPHAVRVNCSNGKGLLVALRNIKLGEEITVSYLAEDHLDMPRDERHLRLAKWGIESCACNRCIDGDDTRTFLCACSQTCDGRIVGQGNSFLTCSHCDEELSASSKADILEAEKMIVGKYCDAEENASHGFDPKRITTIIELATRLKLADEHWVMLKLHDMNADYYSQTGQYAKGRPHFEKLERAWKMGKDSKRFSLQRAFKRMRFSGLLAKCKDFSAAVKVGSCAFAEMRAILPKGHGCLDVSDSMVDPLGSMEKQLSEHLDGQS